MKKLYELINEYCELTRTCDAIEKEWESNPENTELEKVFDKAYEKEFNKYIECANYIVNCTGGRSILTAQNILLMSNMKRLKD